MESLGIDLKLLIAQAINFGLFFWVFKRFLAKPFGKFIQEEKKNEVERERIGQELIKKEEELKAKKETLQKEAKKKTDEAIAEAKKAADVVRKEIIEQANVEVQQIKEKTKKQAQEVETSLLQKAQEKAVELSFFIVDKALKDILTPDLRKEITQMILRNSGKKQVDV